VSFLRQADSVPVPYVSLLPKSVDDSLERSRRTGRDTTAVAPGAVPERAPEPGKARPPRAIPDTTRPSVTKAQVDSILKSRPALSDRLVLRVVEPFVPESRYLLEIRGLRSVAGAIGDAKGVLAIPKPRPLPTPAPDSAAAAPDSTGQVRDSSATPPPAKP